MGDQSFLRKVMTVNIGRRGFIRAVTRAASRDYLNVGWWMSVFPGVALTLTVLTVKLLGDWLRDYLDPALRTL